MIRAQVVFASALTMAADQVSRLPRIGVLWPGAVDQWITAFNDGLRENGYVDGATAADDIGATGGDDCGKPHAPLRFGSLTKHSLTRHIDWYTVVTYSSA